MSNHFSADNLKFPGDDRRLDLTDVFVFPAAPGPEHHHSLLHRHHPGTTVLIMDSNPTSAPPPIEAQAKGPAFYPGAVYRINIDTDGDNHADVAFTFVFSEYENGRQTGNAWYATGAQARQAEPGGEILAEGIPVSFDGTVQPVEANGIRLAAGLRSDPFFADVEGALHGFAWTGHDDFAGNNVDSIVLEVPDDMLGDGPVIGVWASISRYQDGVLEQMDRGGNPTINPFINPDGEKNLFNSRQPADDVANYLGPWSKHPRKRRRLLARAGQGGRPAGAARHPALRPDPARHLPQRPHPHRRRVQPALRLADQRQGPPVRPQAARRPAGPLPLPRPARPQPLRRLLRAGDVTDPVAGAEVHWVRGHTPRADHMQTVTPRPVQDNRNSFLLNGSWFHFHSTRRSRPWNTSSR